MVGTGIPILLCLVLFIWSHQGDTSSLIMISDQSGVRAKDVATFIPSLYIEKEDMDDGNKDRMERGIWGCKEK